MADSEDVGSDSEKVSESARTNQITIVHMKTSATIIPDNNGMFTTTTLTNITYTDGSQQEKTEVVDGKVHAKRKILNTPITGSSSSRNTATKNGTTTTTAYEKYIYGFKEPVVTEDVINSESGPAERNGCCSCSIM